MAQEAKTRLGISAFAVLTFILTFGSIGVRNIIGWPGFLALAVLLTIYAGYLFAKHRTPRFRVYRLPKPLLAFLLLCILSVIWSAYRLETIAATAATLATTFLGLTIASVLTWHELLRTLATALRYILGLSLLFELGVAIFIGAPILQNFVEIDNPEKPSKLLYWSRSLLFEGGPIQGIVANSALLGFMALLGLIVFAVQLRGGLVRPFKGWFWIATALGVLALTRSATVFMALGAVVITVAFVKWARVAGTKRGPVYLAGFALLAVIVTAATLWQNAILSLLGKSSTLTGRTEIWAKVSALAAEKPVFGWGWISHWAPWVEPYASLDEKNGLPVMHAHSAWLDVQLQLGWVGVAVFVPLIAMTLQRLWCRAVDQPRRGVGAPLPYATSAVFPVLVFIALLTQSLSESRLLVEWGWLLLIIFAVKARLDYVLPTKESEPVAVSWRETPIVKS